MPHLQLLVQLRETLLQMLLSVAGPAQSVFMMLCLSLCLSHSCLHKGGVDSHQRVKQCCNAVYVG